MYNIQRFALNASKQSHMGSEDVSIIASASSCQESAGIIRLWRYEAPKPGPTMLKEQEVNVLQKHSGTPPQFAPFDHHGEACPPVCHLIVGTRKQCRDHYRLPPLSRSLRIRPASAFEFGMGLMVGRLKCSHGSSYHVIRSTQGPP